MIVVDASVLVNVLADDQEAGVRARARVTGEVLVAPHLVDIEVVAALRRLNAMGVVGHQRSDRALLDLADLALTRVPHALLLPRCWGLRHNLTTYDAAYIALAEALGALLLTADARLAASPGIGCEVEVLSEA